MRFPGVRIIALVVAALITASGMSHCDFLRYTGIGAATAALLDTRGRARCPEPDTSQRPSCVRL